MTWAIQNFTNKYAITSTKRLFSSSLNLQST